MEHATPRESTPGLEKYNDNQVLSLVGSINYHFKKHTTTQDNVIPPELVTDDEIDAVLELYTIIAADKNYERVVRNVAITSALLSGEHPRKVSSVYRVNSPEDIRSNVSKEVGKVLSSFFDKQGSVLKVRDVVNTLTGALESSPGVEELGEGISLEEEIRTLYDQGKLEMNEAVILLHHFGFERSPASASTLESVYRRSFARLMMHKTQRYGVRTDRNTHNPVARMYLMKMMGGEGRPGIVRLAALSPEKFTEKDISRLLAVGLRELLDNDTD